MSDLYDADILIWSEHQAALLRRLVGLPRTVDGAAAMPIPITCPWTLDELLHHV